MNIECRQTVEEKVLGKVHTHEKTPALFPGSPNYASTVIEEAQAVMKQRQEEDDADNASKTME